MAKILTQEKETLSGEDQYFSLSVEQEGWRCAGI